MKAGYGVWWGDGHKDNGAFTFIVLYLSLIVAVAAPLRGAVQTNNRAEYMAVAEALRIAKERNYPKLVVYTDSLLLYNSLTKWLPAWRRASWKTSTGTPVSERSKELFSVSCNYEHIRNPNRLFNAA